MVRDKYERTIKQFELYYPRYYDRAVDWWPSGRLSIMVKLDDGDIYDYNPLDDSIRLVSNCTNNEDILRKSFGINLQKMIPFSGLSKGELAEKAGITNAMLSRYIRGNSMPNVILARRLANILGCTLDELFDRTYDE